MRSQFLVYEQKLFTSKTYPKFVTSDKFLREIIAHANIQKDMQILNCRIATIFTMVPPGKQNLFKEKKI